MKKSNFGSLSLLELDSFSRDLVYLKDNGLINDLPKNFKDKKGEFFVSKNERKINKNEYNEDFLIRMGIFSKNVKESINFVNENQEEEEFFKSVSNNFVSRFEEIIPIYLDKKEKIDPENKIALKNIENKIFFLERMIQKLKDDEY